MLSPVAPQPDAAAPAAGPVNDPAKVRDAARQFEALLIGQMMKSMQDSEGGWMGTDADDASSSAMQYGTEMFAQAMAASGGLGIAKMVAAGLLPPAKS